VGFARFSADRPFNETFRGCHESRDLWVVPTLSESRFTRSREYPKRHEFKRFISKFLAKRFKNDIPIRNIPIKNNPNGNIRDTMSLKLVLLGLLSDKEMYGYEIHQVLTHKFRNFMPVAFSSIYYNLDSLEKKELITKRTESQDSRPDRNIYTITGTGREEFKRLLEKNIRKEGRHINENDPFNVSVSLMRHYPKEKVKTVFQERVEVLETHIQHHQRLHEIIQKQYQDEFSHHIDFYMLVLLKRGIEHAKAEKEWVLQALDMLDGDLYKEIPITSHSF